MSEVADRETLDALEDIITSHVGRENAITSSELANQLDETTPRGTNPHVRKLIKRLLMYRNIPIASCNAGYFVVSDEDELNDYAENLANRAAEIQTRRMALMKAAHEWGIGGIDEQTGITGVDW